MHREALDCRGAGQQRAEALGPRAIKGARAQRRGRKAILKIRLDSGDDGGFDRAAEDAPAIARERARVAVHDGAHAAILSASPV